MAKRKGVAAADPTDAEAREFARLCEHGRSKLDVIEGNLGGSQLSRHAYWNIVAVIEDVALQAVLGEAIAK